MKLNEIGIGERFEYDGNEYEKLSDAKNCEIYCYNYTKNASTYLPKYLKVTKVREEKERNAVEVWAEEVKNSNKRPFTNKEMENFFCYYFAEAEGLKSEDEEELRELLEKKKGGIASVVYIRAKYVLGYEISVSLAVFLGTILDSFGKSTMIISYLLYVAKKLGVRIITMKEFGINAFPIGLPTEEEWKRLWTLQKLPPEEYNSGSDNGLDCKECFESIKL